MYVKIQRSGFNEKKFGVPTNAKLKGRKRIWEINLLFKSKEK